MTLIYIHFAIAFLCFVVAGLLEDCKTHNFKMTARAFAFVGGVNLFASLILSMALPAH